MNANIAVSTDYWWVRELGKIADLLEKKAAMLTDKALLDIEVVVQRMNAAIVIERKRRTHAALVENLKKEKNA